ncbi:MAG: DUF58 domain-containing protein [Ruminococcus sp.]|nr:DUF58 domain-containing protein [Ruminococcus sp.]
MKSFLSYLLCILTAALLTYEISGTGGIFIIILLSSALAVSAAVLIVSARSVKVDIKLSTSIVGKGDGFDAEICVRKGTLLPTCFVELDLGFTPNVEPQADKVKLRIISASRDGDVIRVPFKAALSGCGRVWAESVTLMDYLGIFRKKFHAENGGCEIRIIPSIPDTGSQTQVLRSTSENASFDDSDEESDETAVGLTGIPGYEHRQYVSGDPLKRINWKLSSKRDVLMVRLDEKVSASSQVFRLDYPEREQADRAYYENADLITEASLGMMAMLLRSGFESEYNFYLDGWECVKIRDEKDLVYLQERLAGIRPYPPEHRLPDHDINKKGKAQLCFTVCMGDMNRELAVLLGDFTGSLAVSEASGVGKVRNDTWSINKDFEFTKMQ